MHYGTLPLVRYVGGLADTIVDATDWTIRAGSATGFAFREPTGSAMLDCLDRALATYAQQIRWRKIQRRGDESRFWMGVPCASLLGHLQQACTQGSQAKYGLRYGPRPPFRNCGRLNMQWAGKNHRGSPRENCRTARRVDSPAAARKMRDPHVLCLKPKFLWGIRTKRLRVPPSRFIGRLVHRVRRSAPVDVRLPHFANLASHDGSTFKRMNLPSTLISIK
jgi:hypothetical protein